MMMQAEIAISFLQSESVAALIRGLLLERVIKFLVSVRHLFPSNSISLPWNAQSCLYEALPASQDSTRNGTRKTNLIFLCGLQGMETGLWRGRVSAYSCQSVPFSLLESHIAIQPISYLIPKMLIPRLLKSGIFCCLRSLT